MAVYYAEFETTAQNLIQDLKTRILLNPDWTWQGLDTAIATSSANAAVGATTMTFASGSIPAAVQVGSIIRLGTYASGQSEYRTVTAVTATVITWSGGLAYAKASGTPIFWGSEVVRTTTVRGAQMILDLAGGVQSGEVRKLATSAYNSFTPPTTTVAPATPGGLVRKSAFWRRANTLLTATVRCTLSTSKDHIYISVEGPRYNEPYTSNTSYGSMRSYVFMSDLVPYSPSDTIPTVAYGGCNAEDPDGTVSSKSHVVSLSKSFDGTQSWVDGVPLALQFPTVIHNVTASAQRMTSIDGTDKYYLSPYVIAANDVGLRGRLSSFFFAGSNVSTTGEPFNPTANTELVYNGVTYKLTAVSKGENAGGSVFAWGPFGAVDNSGTGAWYSPIVAIPMA